MIHPEHDEESYWQPRITRGLRADILCNLNHALAIQRKEQGEKAEVTTFHRKRDRWLKIERIAGRAQEVLFVVGVLAVSGYAILRAIMR